MIEKTASFFDLLRECGVLSREQMEHLAQDPATRGLDARSMARALVQRGWLTRFQVKQIVLGRGKELVFGAYRIMDLLGEGGMGQVFKAHHQAMNRVVALKHIKKARLAKPNAVSRFNREMQLAAQLTHPNIVLAFDAGQEGNTHYLVMEYVDGMSLAQLVRDSGPLPFAQAADYIRQAALGLQHAFERGLVHRDIKPSNLLVTRSPKTAIAADGAAKFGTIKILDMGLARLGGLADEEHGLTREGQVVGTPDYLAPEQARDSRAVDIRADLYSLGCTFYFLLTGRTPFKAGSLAEVLVKHQMEQPRPLEELRPDTPAPVAAVINKLMAKRPEDRFQTPAELAEALEAVARGEAVAALTDVAVKRATPDTEADWESILGGIDNTPSSLSGSATAQGLPKPKRISPSRAILVAAGGATLLVLCAVVGMMVSGKEEEKKSPNASAATPMPLPEPVEQPKEPAVVIQQPSQIVPPVPENRGETLISRHRGPLQALAISQDGSRVLTAAANWAQLWDFESGKQLRMLGGHAQMVSGLALLADNRRAITASTDKSVYLWDLERGQILRRFEGHTAPVYAVAATRDGRRLATGAGTFVNKDGKAIPVDCTVRLWDLNSGQELHRLEAHTSMVQSLCFTPDGNRLVSGGQDGMIRVWDVVSGSPLRSFSGGGGPVTQMACSSDGRRILTSGMDGSARLWELDSGTQLQRLTGHSRTVRAVAISADGRLALTGSGDPEIKDGKIVLRDNRVVATDCFVRLWNLDTGAEIQRFEGHTDFVQCLAFLPDGKRALSGSRDQTVRLWTLNVPPATTPAVKATPAFEGHTGAVNCVALSADGKRLLTGGRDRTVRIWESGLGRELRRLTNHAAEVLCVAISPDGTRAISGDRDGAAFLWDLNTGLALRGYKGNSACEAATFTPEGAQAILGMANGSVQVWQIEGNQAGAITRTFSASNTSIHAVAVSPDSRLVAYGGSDGALRLGEITTGKKPGDFLGSHSRPILTLTFSADGKSVLTGGADGTMRLWSLATGKQVRVFKADPKSVMCLAFTSDGKRILSGGGDHVLRLWDAQSPAQPLRRLEGHTEAIRGLAVTSDGKRAFSVGDGIKSWDLASGKPLP